MNTLHLYATQVRDRRFWRAHIKALAQSGLSRSEYCRQHTLSYHAITYWLRKQAHSLVGSESSCTLVEVPTRLPTIPVQPGPPLRLHVGSGYMIELGPDFDEATLSRTLVVLEQRR